MVSDARRVLVAGEGALAEALAVHYAGHGWRVERLAAADGDPLDLCVLADDRQPDLARLDGLSRNQLAASLERITYAPFQVAATSRRRLSAASGRLVLLSSASARMEQPDPDGAYLDRPFRVAAHALWRCLSVEWAADGISVTLLGLEQAVPVELERLVAAIAVQDTGKLVELRDVLGARLGW